MNKSITKQEILKTMRQFARKHKRNPKVRDLEALAITRTVFLRHWGSMRKALTAAGLGVAGTGFPQMDSTVLPDWGAVARKLNKIPSTVEYLNIGRFSIVPFQRLYRRWSRVPEEFLRFVRETGTIAEWQDVVTMIGMNQSSDQEARHCRRSRRDSVMQDRPIYGPPLPLPELMHEPVSEGGVIYAFGIMARRLGFAVRGIQSAFPDCDAMRETAKGQWQPVRIEFELESRNFLKHKHDPKGCDVIVCWVHNWPECPAHIEVVELSKVMREMYSVQH
ncbi:MAG: homing endonuclease associated repeat-containing protein [Candidatus Angelobacter sp.]